MRDAHLQAGSVGVRASHHAMRPQLEVASAQRVVAIANAVYVGMMHQRICTRFELRHVMAHLAPQSSHHLALPAAYYDLNILRCVKNAEHQHGDILLRPYHARGNPYASHGRPRLYGAAFDIKRMQTNIDLAGAPACGAKANAWPHAYLTLFATHGNRGTVPSLARGLSPCCRILLFPNTSAPGPLGTTSKTPPK